MSLKHLAAKQHFQHSGEFNSRSWTEMMPEEVEYQDLFREDFWVHHAARLRLRDLVRAWHVSGAFDVMLVVEAKVSGGLRMREWPVWPADEAMEAAETVRKAPIVQREVGGRLVPCVEHTKATKWRVIGLDGNEIIRDIQTKAEAIAAMHRHYGEIVEAPAKDTTAA